MELNTEYYEYENKFCKVIKKIGYLSEYNYEYGAWFANLYLHDYTRVVHKGTKLESDEERFCKICNYRDVKNIDSTIMKYKLQESKRIMDSWE